MNANCIVRCVLLYLLVLTSYSAFAQDSISVYFPTGNSTLRQEATIRLDSLFYLEKIQGVTAIYIYGYADEPGGRQINRRLSAARATAVREHLLQSGIRPERIVECTGKGHYSGKGDDPSERRADLLLGSRMLATAPALPAISLIGQSMASLRENETIVLKKIYFKAGDSALLPESYPELERLREFLAQNPGVHIRLEGHACCPMDMVAWFEQRLKRLSENRAESVLRYLKEKGIAAERLSYKGFGNTVPLVNPSNTEEEMQQNRRVEVRIIKK